MPDERYRVDAYWVVRDYEASVDLSDMLMTLGAESAEGGPLKPAEPDLDHAGRPIPGTQEPDEPWNVDQFSEQPLKIEEIAEAAMLGIPVRHITTDGPSANNARVRAVTWAKIQGSTAALVNLAQGDSEVERDAKVEAIEKAPSYIAASGREARMLNAWRYPGESISDGLARMAKKGRELGLIVSVHFEYRSKHLTYSIRAVGRP